PLYLELYSAPHRPWGELREVGSGAGLAEHLAPELLTVEERDELPVLLGLRAGVDDRRPGPPDPDGVDRPEDAGGAELLVDQQLVDGIGVEPPRSWPVRGDPARLAELAAGRARVRGE